MGSEIGVLLDILGSFGEVHEFFLKGFFLSFAGLLCGSAIIHNSLHETYRFGKDMGKLFDFRL